MNGLLSQSQLGNFALVGVVAGNPWLNDWPAYTTQYDWSITDSPVSIPTASWGTVLTISGEGFLTFFRATANAAPVTNPDIRITIDGVSTVFQGSTNGSQPFEGNIIFQPIYFKNGITIECYNSDTVSRGFYIQYSSIVKTSEPSNSKQTLLSQTNRKMQLLKVTSTSLVDVLNIVGSGYVLAIDVKPDTSSNMVYLDLTVDGVNKVASEIWGREYENYMILNAYGPIRFTAGLIVKGKVAAGDAMYRVWYTLD